MNRSLSMIASIPLTWALAMAGCSTASPFDEDRQELSDDGAFLVSLSHDGDDASQGMNGFVIHVGMPGTEPEVGGLGIPGVEIDATFIHETGWESPRPMIRELGGGDYSIEGVHLHRPGGWIASLDLSVGDAIMDHVDFSFSI
jgi:hypothetical protein